MDQSTVDALSFGVGSDFHRGSIVDAYRSSGRTQIPNFLAARDAERLYQYLHTEILWRTFAVADERLLGTRRGAPALDREREQELLQLAIAGAGNGFSSIFDADKSEQEKDCELGNDVSIFSGFVEFLNSERLLNLVREITEIPELSRADAHAVRLRKDHFVTFHNGTHSADATGRRRASYTLNLTPQWRPEWGGLLEFRAREAHLVEAIQPCFNMLTVFAFPQGCWISPVAPYAMGSQYSISGNLYVD